MQSGVRGKTAVLFGVLLAATSLLTAQTTPPGAEQPTKQETNADSAQSAYKPKFAGDPAHSDAEASTLGYMRTVLTAQKLYKRKHSSYATSLAGLVNTGSFTRRMIKTDRGDYDVSFHSQAGGFSLALTPKQFDAGHRAFHSDETGVIRVETDKPATSDSDRLR